MKFLVGLIFLLPLTTSADVFVIEGTRVDFVEKDDLLVKGCEKNCEALAQVKKFPKIGLAEVRKNLKFAGAVGSDVCHEVYKASSVLGRAPSDQRQHAFCYFKDGSMIEINSLTEYLAKKKIVR